MQINISSLDDLATCLKSDRLALKLNLLQKVHKQLEEGRKRGSTPHPALLDLLYDRYRQTQDKEERTWCACILLQHDAARQVMIAEEQFFAHDDNAILLLCAEVLTALSPARRAELLRLVVMEGSGATRQRLAANLLSDCLEHLAADVALRVAILSDHPLPMDEISHANLDLWIQELCGPYRQNVRRILSRLGKESFGVLLRHWEKLPHNLAAWVIDQAVKKELDEAQPLLLEIIEKSRDVGLLKPALQALKTFLRSAGQERLLEPLYRHEDSTVCAAALTAGQGELNWADWLGREVHDEVRLAVLKRIARDRCKTSLPCLDRLLDDQNWKVRAGTTEALIALAPESLDLLKKRLLAGHAQARISAAQALQQLGQEKWTLEALA